MNFNNFTIKSQEAIQKAVEVTKGKGQQSIEPTHILMGVMLVGENIVNFLFQKLGVNTGQLSSLLSKEIESYSKVSGGEPYLSRESNAALEKAMDYAKKMGDQFVSIEHILLGVLAGKNTAAEMLKDAGVSEREMQLAINELRKGSSVTSQSAEDTYQSLE